MTKAFNPLGGFGENGGNSDGYLGDQSDAVKRFAAQGRQDRLAGSAKDVGVGAAKSGSDR